MRAGTAENNTDLLHSTHTNTQVSDSLPRGANVLILTYVSTNASVKQPLLAGVPHILT